VYDLIVAKQDDVLKNNFRQVTAAVLQTEPAAPEKPIPLLLVQLMALTESAG